jgi:hypothetical protein
MNKLAYFQQDKDGLLELAQGQDLHTTLQKQFLARTINLMFLSSRETFTINELLEELPVHVTRACVTSLVNNLVTSNLVLRFEDTEANTYGRAYFYKINLS